MREWKRSFTVPIYECRIILVMSEDLPASLKRLPVSLRNSEKEPVACGGFCVSTYPDYAMMFPYEAVSLGTLAHEIGHISRRIMSDIGFAITADNDEPLAYLEGYLTRRVHDILKKEYEVHKEHVVKGREGA